MFPLSFRLIYRYHQEYPILTENNNSEECIKGSFCGVQNNINLVTFNDKIVIPQLLQMYVVEWYHAYILHPGLDRTEAMLCQYLNWPVNRKTVREEVTKCDVCQHTKRSTKKRQIA